MVNRLLIRSVALIAGFATAFAVAESAQAKPTPHTSITNAPAAMTSSTSATLAFTSSISGSTFTCSLDGAKATACTSPKTYTGLAEGRHTFTATATASGVADPTPASTAWTVDSTAPAAPTNLDGTANGATSVALTWKAGTDGNGVTSNQIRRDGTLLATVGAVTSYNDSTVTAGSSHGYTVAAVDAAGNNSVASNSVTVTTQAAASAPDTVIDSGPSGTVTSPAATFAFHSTVSGATFTCRLDSGKALSCTSPRSYSGLAQGAHSLTVTATASGLADATPAKATWTVDSIAPTVPAGLSAQSAGAGTVHLSWTASTDTGGVAGYDVFRNGALLASAGSGTTYTDNAATSGSTYKYAVRATDTAGNTSAQSTPAFVKVLSGYDPHLTRAPYLTDLVGRHVAINFATDQSSGTASVQYGAVDGSGNCTPNTTVTPGRTTIQVGTVSEYQWTAEIDLPAAGTYCYRVSLGGTDLLAGNASPHFTTQVPVGSTGFTFDVMGDWGQVDANGQNPDQANLMTQIASSGARFMVTVGDNGYPNGSQTNYGDLQQTGADTSAIFGPSMWTVPGASIPIFTAPGNHGLSGVTHTDITTWTQANAVSTSGGRYQNDVYCCVNGSSSANYGSEWYAFDAGNTRIYVLDSAWGDTNGGTANPYANDALAHFAPGTPEYQWLANDLRTHTPQLKLAFSHYPLYSDNNTQPSDTYLDGAANLEGLLAANGVQMAFNGHAHTYERNTASASGMPITYVTGGGGATLEPMGTCHTYDAYAIGWSPTSQKGSTCGSARTPASAANVYHFLKVTVNGTSVTVAPTDSLGNTFDVRTYTFKSPTDTYLDSTPPTGTGSTTATFAFHASGSPATFTCKLDNGSASSCASPKTYTGIAEGQHTFTVAATVNKQTDPTPATYTWAVDKTPPGVPANLAANAASPFEVDLKWDAAHDNTGVTGYRIFRDGSFYQAVDGNTTSFADPVPGSSTHSYAVSAVDAAGNESAQSTAVQITTPAPPVPVFQDGFESGDLSAWGTHAGLVVESTDAHSGQSAAEGATTNGNTFAKKTLPSSYSDGYARLAFRVLSQSGQINLLRMRDGAGTSVGYVYLSNTGFLGFHDDTLGTNTLSNVTPDPGWHVVELRIAVDSSAGTATGTVQVWLDNVLLPALSNNSIDVGAAQIGSFQIGDVQTGRTYDVLLDDAAFGTSRLGAATDSALPAVPTGLAANANSAFEVDLTWDPPTDDTNGYNIYRDGTLLDSVGQLTNYADATVLPGRSYSYSISALDAAKNMSDQSAAVQITTPAAQLPVFADGFESGDTSNWSSSSGLTVQSTQTRSGTYAAEGNTTTGATWARETFPASYTDAYARVTFAVNSIGSQTTLLRLRDGPTGVGGYVYLTASGRLGFRSDALATGTTSSVTPGSGWHVVELHLNIAGANSSVQVWLDGAAVPDLTFPVIDLGSSPIKVLQIGDTTTSGSWDILFDDAAFGTSRLGPATDSTPPTTPGNVTATAASPFSVGLSWDASSDDSGVVGYDVYRDGSLIATNVAITQYTDSQVLAGTSYSYEVVARDSFNNVSARSTPADVTTPAAATLVFADGFESGDRSAWSSTAGLVVQTGDVRTGSYAAEGNTTTGATYAKKTLGATYDDGYARVAFDVKSQVSQINLLRLRDSGGTSLGYVYLDTSGRLGLHLDGPNTNTVSTAVPAAGWHVVEVHMTISSGVVEVWLDGALVTALSKSAVALGSTPIGAIQIGETTTARTYDVVFDDAAFSDARIGVS